MASCICWSDSLKEGGLHESNLSEYCRTAASPLVRMSSMTWLTMEAMAEVAFFSPEAFGGRFEVVHDQTQYVLYSHDELDKLSFPDKSCYHSKCTPTVLLSYIYPFSPFHFNCKHCKRGTGQLSIHIGKAPLQ